VHAPTEDKTNEELEHVLDQFPKQQLHILSGDFDAKVRTEHTFKLIIGNDSLYEISSHNALRVLQFTTSKSVTVKGMMFQHDSINKFANNSPDGKIYIYYILIDWRRHSSLLDIRFSEELTVIPITDAQSGRDCQ
jgi:hypothetical protein